MRRLLFAAALLVSGLPLQAAEPCVTLDNGAVAALFDDWNFSLSSLDANKVAQRYWPDAVLLPTVSNTPRTNPAAISDYFEHFLAKRPRGHVESRAIQSGCNLAVDMGTYTFSLMDDKGTTTEMAARYTFVYQYREGAWKILHHHSSAMPEGGAGADPKSLLANDNPTSSSTPAAAEPKPAKARKERRVPRKDYLEPDPPAAKPVAASATAPVAAAKPAADMKPLADAQPKPDAKLPADAKTPDPKSAAAAKPVAATAVAAATPPADAKLPPEVRTAMFANLTSSPAPSKFYPPEALRRKERGSVNLKVCADGQGAVSQNMEVVRSSGSKLLDEAAMTWARSVTWVPATYNRQRVEGCAKVDVAFEPPPDLAHART
jgi:uncharacterized protein (TIGR02246 family)